MVRKYKKDSWFYWNNFTKDATELYNGKSAVGTIVSRLIDMLGPISEVLTELLQPVEYFYGYNGSDVVQNGTEIS